MTSKTEFTAWFAPTNNLERRILSNIYSLVGGIERSESLLRNAFMLGQFTIESLEGAFENAVATMQHQFPMEDQYTHAWIALVHLLFPHLPDEHRSMFRKLRIFSGYFGDTTATGIFAPEFAYEHNEQTSPIDDLIAVLVSYGLVEEYVAESGLASVTLYKIPDFVKLYLDTYVPALVEEDLAMPRFAEVYADIAELLAEDIAYNPSTAQMARFLFLDMRRGLEHCAADARVRYSLFCAHIASILGDDDLATQMRENALDNQTKLWEVWDAYAPPGTLSAGLRHVFPATPVTKQEELDKLVFTAADQMVDLGILRKLFLDIYDPTMSIPAFVEQLSLTPVFEPPENTDRLDEAIEAAKAALGPLRQGGHVPTAAIIAFGLGRLYALKGLFTQANSQLDNTIKYAKEMKDRRLKGIAHHELGSVRIFRGLWEETNTLNQFFWARSILAECGDFRNASAASLASEVFTTLRGIPFTHESRARRQLVQSGLTRNAYHQSIQDVDAFCARLSSIAHAGSRND